MTTSKNTAKAAVDTTATEVPETTEASVPQQNTGEKVTVLKGRGGETGDKDAIVISQEDEENAGVVDKFKSLIRNKKVLAGLGTVAAIAIFALAKSMMAGSDEEIVVEPDTNDEDEASSDTTE